MRKEIVDHLLPYFTALRILLNLFLILVEVNWVLLWLSSFVGKGVEGSTSFVLGIFWALSMERNSIAFGKRDLPV